MAKIPLRQYTNQIEKLIEQGEIEQAIAHAKNILKAYTKHVETYRLLGKAYLESQRYSEASDILQRLLSVIPDDFISHLGMSIIREDEGNLDAAIWHMERAYEVQPFNPAVQDELRRLYGRRDGSEPPKIRLTRGALVRMYARGELYPQAIAEIRSALSEDPQRLDLQVLLARMYYQTGQKVEAAEVCSSLISKLPYCLEANRILAELLPGTSRAEDAEIFQQRLVSLDPYQAFVSPTAPTVEQVADQAVMVEPFLMEETMDQAQPPDWARNAGVQWQEEEQEDLPDWLNALPPVMHAADSDLEIAAEQEPEQSTADSQAEDIIPDFMKAAGWTASNGTSEEMQLVFSDDDEESEAAPAEIPEWLQEIAPAQSDEVDMNLESEKLDWLNEILPPESASPSTSQTVNIYEANAPLETPLNPSPEAEEPAPLSEIPEWLTGIEPEPASDASAGEIPEWLKEMDTQITSPDEVSAESILPDFSAQATVPEGSPAESAADDEIPDWLRGFEGAETEPPAVITQPLDTPETPASDQPSLEETWSEQFAESTSPTEMPEWLQSFTAETPETTPPTASSLEEEQRDEIPDWLKDSEAEVEITEPEPPVEAISAVRIYPADDQEDQTPLSTEGSIVEETPAADVPDLNDMDAAMAWLEGLAVKQGADEAALTTVPEDRTETPPDWVQELGTSETVPTEMTPAELQPQSAEAAPELPDWLQETPTSEPEIPQPSAQEDEHTEGTGLAFGLAAAADEIPEWLRGDDQDQGEMIDQPETSGALSEQPVEKLEETVETKDTVAEIFDATAAEQPEPLDLTTEPSNEIPDLNDMDAAMAWLESLAAKQGADEETLITAPEERVETPPEWVQDLATEGPDAEVLSSSMESEAPPVVSADTEPAADEADLPDWLKEMAPEASEFEQSAAQIFDQPEVEPESPAESPSKEADIPDWLQEMTTEVSQPAAQVYNQEVAPEISPMLNEADSEAPEAEQPIAQIYSEAEEERGINDEAELPEWLLAMDTSEAEESQPTVQIFDQAGTEPSTSPEPEVEQPEIPDWRLKTRELKEPETTPPVETLSEVEQMPDFDDADAAMAWLESLAAKQGADEATLTTSPDERTDTPPEWVRQEMESQNLEPEPSVNSTSEEPEIAGEASQPEAQLPEAVTDNEEPQSETNAIDIYPTGTESSEVETASDETSLDDADEAFAWLESLAANQGAEEETLITAPENRQEITPEWLQQEQPSVEQEPSPNEWVAESSEATPGETNEEDLPDWLLMELAEQESQSNNQETVIEQSIREPSVDEWLRDIEKESELGLLQDDSAEKPAEVDFTTAWSLDQQPSAFEEEPVESAAPAAEITTLQEAQDALNRGRVDAALVVYNRFIQQGEYLEETIHDLRDALYRYPIDINIWQAIGDAYARNNQLQEALDAYTKAEELLR